VNEYRRTVICLLVAAGAFGACSRQPATTTTTAQPAAAAAQPAQPAAAAPQADQATPPVVTGSVVETMDAANYTYMRVKTDKGEIWAATSTFKVTVGDRVVVPLDMPMENFRSKALNRDFPLIYFSSQIAREVRPHRLSRPRTRRWAAQRPGCRRRRSPSRCRHRRAA